jgi:hypothetical protein
MRIDRLKLAYKSTYTYLAWAFSFFVVCALQKGKGVPIYITELLIGLLVFLMVSILFVTIVGGCIWIFKRGQYLKSFLYAMYYSSLVAIIGNMLAIVLLLSD